MTPGVDFTELTGGGGCSIMSATPGPDLEANGFQENEYAASGVATRYAHAGPDSVAPLGEDKFATRVLVRRPRLDADFSGTVVVEWLNVSSGSDAAPEYTYLAEELVRGGYAWVGVSAQYTGVMGGSGSVDGLGAGTSGTLAAKDPERYTGLHHPGDAYCYDLFGAVGRSLLLPSAAGAEHPLRGLSVRRLLAVGESQSAMALTTYANLFAAEHAVFDGLLIHSRAAAGLSLGEAGTAIDVDAVFAQEPVTIRTDLPIPVFIVQTETDVLTNFRFYRARQPDTDRLRVWEIAGTSHADLHQIGPYEHMLGCPTPVNRGQQRFVLRAALHHLRDWADGGPVPPAAMPLELDATANTTQFALDEVGNVRGGVRTPCVDAPIEILSGIVGDDVPRICVLFGSTLPIAPDILASRYAGRDDYEQRYRAATTAAVEAGFILAADRDEALADARPDVIPD
ncbi:alpha/beta hydrolase domain-containing protein [Gordonia sp. SL306]|uniref:alpha/beta hydrolase domain-containing protein n=1 Tax=Gordonia sp. SL306 TaxID=2995145 RepID=UPI003B63E6DD